MSSLQPTSVAVGRKRLVTVLVAGALATFGLSSCSKKEESSAPKDQPVAEQTKAQAAQVPVNVAYVSSQDGHITAYSLDDYSIKATYQVGEGGRGLNISDDGKFLVVAVQDSGDLAIIDTTVGDVVRRVHVGKNPEFVRLMGNMAFVAYEPEATGGPPPKPGTPEYEEMLKKREEKEDEDPARVALVDVLKGEKIKEITAGVETEGIEFSADGKHLIVTNESDENVSVHDIATGEKVSEINTREFGLRPRGIKRSPDGKEYAVTLEFGNKIIFLDDQYNKTREVDTGEVPYGVAYTKGGDEVIVALARGQKLQVFDTKTLELKREIPVGKRCWHFSYTPDLSQIWIACGRSSEVLVLDAKTGEQLKSLPDDKMPWGVVTYPKSVGSLEVPM